MTEKNKQLKEALESKIGTYFNDVQENFGILTATVPLVKLYRVIHDLYKGDVMKYCFLTDICGVHYPDRKGGELAVVYHFHDLYTNVRLRVKSFIDINNPEVPSITGIFASAGWMERETYDFYGIEFVGHPELKRILNMDEMSAFPLRKEYPLEDPTRRDKLDYHFGR